MINLNTKIKSIIFFIILINFGGCITCLSNLGERFPGKDTVLFRSKLVINAKDFNTGKNLENANVRMGINNIRGKNFTIEGLYCDRWTNKKGKCDIFLESWILNNKIPDKTLAGYKDSIIVSFTIPKH